jgi:hypothetical protein
MPCCAAALQSHLVFPVGGILGVGYTCKPGIRRSRSSWCYFMGHHSSHRHERFWGERSPLCFKLNDLLIGFKIQQGQARWVRISFDSLNWCHAGSYGVSLIFRRTNCNPHVQTGLGSGKGAPYILALLRLLTRPACNLPAPCQALQQSSMCKPKEIETFHLLQLVAVYTRGMIPGLWPYIWSCVIMKVMAPMNQYTACSQSQESLKFWESHSTSRVWQGRDFADSLGSSEADLCGVCLL